MEPAQIRDDVDPDSPKYRKELIAVIFIVLGLGIFGGTCLGMKIGDAEERSSATQAESAPSAEATGSTDDQKKRK